MGRKKTSRIVEASISKMYVVASLLLLAIPCLSHQRLAYPPPRETNAAPNNNAPCGATSFGQAHANNLTTDWTAGQKVTIVIYEQIYHNGNPMRLAISGSNNEEFDDCIWLNHIPRHALGTLNGGRNMSITLTVPDMNCKNCTLQLLGLQNTGKANDECCAYTNNDTNSCGLQQYYSCANININGGKRDRKDVCVQPEGWQYRDLPCNYYKAESSANAWSFEGNAENELVLKTKGSILGAPEIETFCKDSELNPDFNGIQANYECHRTATDFTKLSLIDGGDMQTDGVVAIVIIIVLGVAIAATYFIAKKRGLSNDETA